MSVADRYAAHLLFGRVAAGLLECLLDGAAVPCERAWVLALDDQVLDPEAGEQNVGVADLVVGVSRRPVEDQGKEVLDDVLGRPVGRVSEALALLQPLAPRVLEGPPATADPLVAAAL